MLLLDQDLLMLTHNHAMWQGLPCLCMALNAHIFEADSSLVVQHTPAAAYSQPCCDNLLLRSHTTMHHVPASHRAEGSVCSGWRWWARCSSRLVFLACAATAVSSPARSWYISLRQVANIGTFVQLLDTTFPGCDIP
jgi:hypothetical protein